MFLTAVEARDLVRTIIDAVVAVEGVRRLRASWVSEALDWCLLILDRIDGGDGGAVP